MDKHLGNLSFLQTGADNLVQEVLLLEIYTKLNKANLLN